MASRLDRLLHDLSNRMTLMGGSAWMLLAASKDDPKFHQLVQEIEQAMNTVRAMQREVAACRARRDDDEAA